MKKIIITLLTTIISVSVLASCPAPRREQWTSANEGWQVVTNDNISLSFQREWRIRREYDTSQGVSVQTRAPSGPCRYILTYPTHAITQEGFSCYLTLTNGKWPPFIKFEGYDNKCASKSINEIRPMFVRDHTIMMVMLNNNASNIYINASAPEYITNIYDTVIKMSYAPVYAKKYCEAFLEMEFDNSYDTINEELLIMDINDRIDGLTDIDSIIAVYEEFKNTNSVITNVFGDYVEIYNITPFIRQKLQLTMDMMHDGRYALYGEELPETMNQCQSGNIVNSGVPYSSFFPGHWDPLNPCNPYWGGPVPGPYDVPQPNPFVPPGGIVPGLAENSYATMRMDAAGFLAGGPKGACAASGWKIFDILDYYIFQNTTSEDAASLYLSDNDEENETSKCLRIIKKQLGIEN